MITFVGMVETDETMTVDVDGRTGQNEDDKYPVRIILKTALFTIFVPGTVAGLVPQQLARRDRKSNSSGSTSTRIAGSVSLLLGLLLYLHTGWRFADEGGGTPSPTDEPEMLVTGGIYSFVRNPMYVAVLLCIGGQALLYNSKRIFLYGLVSWLVFDRWIAEYEEPHLTEKHGVAYEEYCERVPRWIPQLRSTNGGSPE